MKIFKRLRYLFLKWCHWVFLVNFALCKKKKKKINRSFRVGKEWRAISAPKPQFWVRKQLQRYKMDTVEKTFKNLNCLWQPQSRKKLSCSPLFPLTFSLSFLLSGLLSWVQMGFTDNFRIAYFFLLICILFISIHVDFIDLLSNHPESLDRDYIKMSILLLLH